MQQGHKNKLIVVAGPTASGKTALAIALAQHFNTEILSFDSRQCYAELHIGVARPSRDELAQVLHHFIASHSIHQPVDAAEFAAYGDDVLQKIFATNKIAVAVGGTGLYLKALVEGLDDIPAVDAALRANLRVQFEKQGIDWLKHELQSVDSDWAQQSDMKNPHRMLRALEVKMQTGHSILFYQKLSAEKNKPYEVIEILLSPPREELYKRINERVDYMISIGLFEEVSSLQQWQNVQPLQTVGYTEIFSYLNGDCSIEAAVAKIKQHTRNYAKRQLTWWRNHSGLRLNSPERVGDAIAYVKNQPRIL